MEKIKIDSRTSGLESGIVCSSFDKALAELKTNGFEVISVPQNAELRIKEGEKAYLSQEGNYVREAGISIPNKGIYLVRNSPLLQFELAKKAVEANISGKEYSIEASLAKEYENKASNSLEAEVFHLTNLEPIKANEFEKDKRALWIFQDKAGSYGKFLYDSGVKEMPLWFEDMEYINSQKNAFTNQLMFRGLAGRLGTYLGSSHRSHDVEYNVRGMRKITESRSEDELT